MAPPVTNSTQGTLIPIQQSPLLQMSKDILIEIFKRMGPVNIGTCQVTCKRLYNLFSQDDVWKRLFENHFPNRIVIPNEINNFQKAYKDRLYNLHKGCFSLQFVDGPKIGYSRRALAAYDGKFFYGTYGHIEVWDLITKTKIGQLRGYEYIYSLVPYKGNLLSTSYNKITIWDLNTNASIVTLDHQGLHGIAVSDDGRLFSLGDNMCGTTTIKVWDLNTHVCVDTHVGDQECIIGDQQPILISNDKLFFSDRLGKIKIKDLNNKNSGIAILEGHEREVVCFAKHEERLVSGSSDHTIKIWDLDTSTCKATLKGHTDVVCSIVVMDDMLFSGSWDKTIKIWDLNANSCMTTIDGYSGRVTFLDVSKGKLFSRFDNGAIQMWDFEAEHNEILEELADTLEKGILETNGSINYLNKARAMDRFLKMPKAKRNKIYGELYKILKPLNPIQHDYWGCAEHAFHDQNGQSSTPAQKAQAIRNFLKEEFT